MRTCRDIKGFTVVELLVALVVTSVILSAVAALAFAMNTAANVGADTALSQAQLRHTCLRLRDLIGNGKLICAAPGNDLVVWRADDNGNEAIDVNEVVYIERGTDLNRLRLCRFETVGSNLVTLGDLADSNSKSALAARHNEQFTPLVPDCNDVSFTCRRDDPSDPMPLTRHVTVSLGLIENGSVRRYEIDAALRAWAGHLLSADGTALVSDDD